MPFDLAVLAAGIDPNWVSFLRDWDRTPRAGNYPETTRYNYLLTATQLARDLTPHPRPPRPSPARPRRRGIRRQPADLDGSAYRRDGQARMTGLPRRLPRPVPPAHRETAASFVRRLAAIHGMPYSDLWRHVSATQTIGGTIRHRRIVVAERLAAVTGLPINALRQAMLELRTTAPNWTQWRDLEQAACPRCTARHPGGPVTRLFQHHEYVCTRHGYWLGPPECTQPELSPHPLAALAPALISAQHRHSKIVRRYGWLHAFAGFAVSAPLCVDQRDLEPSDSPKRRLYDQRVDQIIPKPTTFTAALFLAAFYPEIVNLIDLFCAPAWRSIAMQATRSDAHLTTIATEISRAIGREARPYELTGSATTMWLRALRSMPPDVLPLRTFPQSRRASLDGVPNPNQPSRPDEKRKVRAVREFRKHRHIPAWTLPRNVRWPDDIHQPRTVLGLDEPPHGWS